MNYARYYIGGIESGEQLINNFERHIELKNKNILDWGCGPARIIRHFPETINNGCKFYGSDYNKITIEWCKKNIKNIAFNNNSLEASLPYDDGFFDVIYGLSVFTHLSEKLHYDWFLELYRVLNKNGILYLTTQGDNFKNKMTDEELIEYNKGNIIVRGNVLEGHRTYSAFHPNEFMIKLFNKVEIVEHIVTKPIEGWIPQDIWIVKKSNINKKPTH